jgi:hypothetical protein
MDNPSSWQCGMLGELYAKIPDLDGRGWVFAITEKCGRIWNFDEFYLFASVSRTWELMEEELRITLQDLLCLDFVRIVISYAIPLYFHQ